MSLQVIGAGLGRTGTHSLKLAINRLGLGPCHHMEAVAQNQPVQVPLWEAAVAGRPDWPAIYEDHASAVDWPTAGFFRQLHAAYPSARFVLTVRSPESWARSFSETIYKLLQERDKAPPQIQGWLDMVVRVVTHTGVPMGLDVAGLTRAYTTHVDAVKAAIPARQLLIYEVKQGWAPLCAFLNVPVPDEPFPRTNAREEFWDLVAAATGT